jgi:hypothetical protein
VTFMWKRDGERRAMGLGPTHTLRAFAATASPTSMMPANRESGLLFPSKQT